MKMKTLAVNIEALTPAEFKDAIKKGARVVVNAGTPKDGEYYLASVTKLTNKGTIAEVRFDDGEDAAYLINRSKSGIVGLAKTNKKRKAHIEPKDVNKYLLTPFGKGDRKVGKPKEKIKPKQSTKPDMDKEFWGSATRAGALFKYKQSAYQMLSISNPKINRGKNGMIVKAIRTDNVKNRIAKIETITYAKGDEHKYLLTFSRMANLADIEWASKIHDTTTLLNLSDQRSMVTKQLIPHLINNRLFPDTHARKSSKPMSIILNNWEDLAEAQGWEPSDRLSMMKRSRRILNEKFSDFDLGRLSQIWEGLANTDPKLSQIQQLIIKGKAEGDSTNTSVIRALKNFDIPYQHNSISREFVITKDDQEILFDLAKLGNDLSGYLMFNIPPVNFQLLKVKRRVAGKEVGFSFEDENTFRKLKDRVATEIYKLDSSVNVVQDRTSKSEGVFYRFGGTSKYEHMAMKYDGTFEFISRSKGIEYKVSSLSALQSVVLKELARHSDKDLPDPRQVRNVLKSLAERVRDMAGRGAVTNPTDLENNLYREGGYRIAVKSEDGSTWLRLFWLSDTGRYGYHSLNSKGKPVFTKYSGSMSDLVTILKDGNYL